MLRRLLLYGKYRRAVAFSVLLCCCLISAQAQYFTLDGNSNRVSMPFLFVRNMVIIKLKINNRGPFNFILDTGVGQMLITEPSLVDSISITSKRTIKISGFGEGQDFEAFVTPPLNIQMKGLTSHYVTAAILKKDFFGLSNYAGMRIHGLLGYDFFNRLAVKIDFADSTVTAFTPGKFTGFSNGIKLPISIEENRPYLETKVTCNDGTETMSKLIVDLGAGHAMTLENVANKTAFSPTLIAGNLGVGIKGLISGYLGRIKAIDIGKYKIKDLIASYPEDDHTKSLSVPRDGNLGIDVLKKFKIVFDYTNGVMYLKASSGFNEPFEHDMSGLEYYASGEDLNHIIIDRVEPGSPGEAAGLVKDDEITAINFKPVSSMHIEDIDELFRSRDNRILILDIYHDQSFKTFITLKRRI
jgi:hypothetical protein